jgi:hypothetical protein
MVQGMPTWEKISRNFFRKMGRFPKPLNSEKKKGGGYANVGRRVKEYREKKGEGGRRREKEGEGG